MIRFVAVAALAGALAAPAFAQDAHADHAHHAAQADAAAGFSLDTPVDVLVADARAKAVLDADLPGLTTHEHYEMFKMMSLNQIAAYAPDKVTPELVAKVSANLAAIK